MTQARAFGCALLAVMAALAMASAVLAEEEWPTGADVYEHGTPIQAEELDALLQSNTVIIEFPGEGYGQGFLADCRTEAPVIANFTGAESFREEGASCEVEDARLCLHLKRGVLCVEARTLPGWDFQFLTLVDAGEGDALGEEGHPAFATDEAMLLATVPARAEVLLEARGEIDLGPMSITLPKELSFSLRMTSDFPLALMISDPNSFGVEVLVDIIGWPDPFRQAGINRVPEPGDHSVAKSRLEEFVEENRPPKGGGSKAGQFNRYSATPLSLPRGPCVRIDETRPISTSSIQETPGIKSLLATQACIDPAAGTMFRVSVVETRWRDNPFAVGEIEAFWGMSHAILDTIRMGPSEGE